MRFPVSVVWGPAKPLLLPAADAAGAPAGKLPANLVRCMLAAASLHGKLHAVQLLGFQGVEHGQALCSAEVRGPAASARGGGAMLAVAADAAVGELCI